MKEGSPLGAYFYPLSSKSPERVHRAQLYEYDLKDETVLPQEARPLYKGHKQPNTYCLGDSKLTTWDDSDPSIMKRQIELAKESGLDFFIFNTYIGSKNGQIIRDLTEPLEQSFLKLNSKFGFGVMFTLGQSRVVLPIPANPDFKEQDRNFDLNELTVKSMVDSCATKYWQKNSYLHIKQRPYISIYKAGLDLSSNSPDFNKLGRFIELIRNYSTRKYGIDPYIVGVIKVASDGKQLERLGVDALTGYAFLPNFSKSAPPIQNYDNLLNYRMREWDDISNSCKVPFIPPAVVGWDASPRGEQGYDIKKVAGIYPYTPIVEKANSISFKKMLNSSISFVQKNTRNDEQYNIICAWNEVSEGCSLLPTIENEHVSFDYLNVIKTTVTRNN